MTKTFGIGALLALAGMASASTIDTFSFQQTGYTEPGQADGTLTGQFTGTVEPDGNIELTDLMSFTEQFAYGNITVFGYGPETFFSFNVNGGGSSLDAAGPIGIGGTACTGAVAAFGFGSCASSGVDGYVVGFTTPDVATVTLISSVTQNPPAVPEPGTWSLLASGIAGVVAWRRLRGRSGQPR